MRFSVKTVTWAAIMAGLLGLAGCAAGPDYVKPAAVAVMPGAYKEMSGWKVAQPKDGAISGKWWTVYDDPLLNALESRVVMDNQNIKAYEAAFRQAQALVQSVRAGFFPTLAVGASATGTRTSANLSGSNAGKESTEFQLPFSLNWEADLWGKIRRGIEAGKAGVQASAADLIAATLSAQSELAVDYFQLRVIDAQRQLLDDTAACYQKSLEMTQNRYDSGIAASSDVLQAETQLKTTQAQAIDLMTQRAQMEHAIALLIGKPASDFSLKSAPLAIHVPVPPVGVPSELLEHRPDIASAERKMAQANAQIGIAEAAYYPAIQLSGSTGFDASNILEVMSWPARFWSVGPAISETLFDGGLRKAQSQQAIAAYDQTVATYRQTVLSSFQGVEDNLAALRILEKEAAAQQSAVDAARQAVNVIENQYRQGTVAYLNVIASQTTALSSERTALTIQGNRLAASVLLIKALGGGWNADRLPEG